MCVCVCVSVFRRQLVEAGFLLLSLGFQGWDSRLGGTLLYQLSHRMAPRTETLAAVYLMLLLSFLSAWVLLSFSPYSAPADLGSSTACPSTPFLFQLHVLYFSCPACSVSFVDGHKTAANNHVAQLILGSLEMSFANDVSSKLSTSAASKLLGQRQKAATLHQNITRMVSSSPGSIFPSEAS